MGWRLVGLIVGMRCMEYGGGVCRSLRSAGECKRVSMVRGAGAWGWLQHLELRMHIGRAWRGLRSVTSGWEHDTREVALYS